jgi:Ni/Fe-hydrogenase 1 B-type cytochrome subunit
MSPAVAREMVSTSGEHYPIEAHPAEHSDLVRVYVWEWPVRLAHWGVVFSITVLSVTGIYIGNPMLVVRGTATENFLMGTFKVVHSYAAILFTLSVLSRILWMFLGNHFARWDKFIPVKARRRKAILSTLRFYLFQLRKPPGFIGHNPLAGLTYTFVFLIYLVMIVTGFVLYGASADVGSHMRVFHKLIPLFGGLQLARLIHHGGMWLLIGFAIHHVYSSVLMSQVEANATTESIFSGYKFVHKDDVIYSGYRYIDPKDIHERHL